MEKTVDERVKELEEKVSALQKQVAELRLAAGIEPVVQPAIEPEFAQEEVVETEEPPIPEPEPVVAVQAEPEEKPVSERKWIESEVLEEEEAEEESSGLESKLGKRVMSILASILVFVSLVLFGNLIQPYFTPAVKTAMMFVLSIALTAFGLWKMKDTESRFATLYTAVTACGIGAIYLSSIVSRFVLGTFTDITLLVAIAIWIVGVLIVVKFKSGIFTFICYAGIVIATMLAAYNWPDSILGLVVYVAAMAVLFALNFSKDLKKVWWFILQLPIVCGALMLAYSTHLYFFCIIYALLLVVILASLIYYKVEDSNWDIMILVNVIFYGNVMHLLRGEFGIEWEQYAAVANIVFALSCIAICCLLYRYFNTRSKYLFLVPYFVSAFVLCNLNYSEFYSQYIGLLPFFAVTIALGAFLKNRYFRYTGYVYLFMYIAGGLSGLSVWTILGIAALTVALMILWCWKNYCHIDKLILTLLVLEMLFRLFTEGIFDECVLYLILGIISIAINLPWYSKNPSTSMNEPITQRLCFVYNELLAFVGIVLIHFYYGNMKFVSVVADSTTLGVILIALLALALSCINIKRLYDVYGEFSEGVLSVYTCLKLSAFALVVLLRLHSVSYVISLVGIVLAIAFICVGFYSRLKGFRLYGLFLCLICVAKLLLFDVNYTSSLMRPVGYLTAGLLCYLISWIYSKLEKKL